jgi:hypothetical protein
MNAQFGDLACPRFISIKLSIHFGLLLDKVIFNLYRYIVMHESQSSQTLQ